MVMLSAIAAAMCCAPAPDTLKVVTVSPPELPREFRAVWVATVDNIDWPSVRGLSTEKAQAELRAIFDRAKKVGLNAIIFQVRPHADAMYASDIEPWSEYLTGKQGKAPDPYWDPLQFAIDEAHLRGMELHAWVNPYRAWHPAAKGSKAPNYIGNTEPAIVKEYGKYEWMDPSEPEVQDRTYKVMIDIVKRYDLDGIHIDDYFYPYKVKDDKGKDVDFPDSRSWGRYKASSGLLSRGDWRRKSVDDFIQRVYSGIKAEKTWVKFGISPFGIYRPNVPEGIKAGVDQYADLYADARKWLREGWLDYFTPQLYWPISQTPQSYPVLLKWWLSQNVKERHMWPGNYTGRTDPGNGNWKSDEVVNQIGVTRKLGAGGNVHFSMKCFMRNWNGITDSLVSGPYAGQALIPASPWLDKEPPATPVADATKPSDKGLEVSWKQEGEPVRFYLVQAQRAGKWRTVAVGSSTSVVVPLDDEMLSITPIDRAGNVGVPLGVSLR